MNSIEQQDLFQRPAAPVTEDDQFALRSHLRLHGWQTRAQLVTALGWSERKVRDVAESLGSKIVRGQAGFKLTDDLTRQDLTQATQASDAAISQGKKMIRYGFALRKQLHQNLG